MIPLGVLGLGLLGALLADDEDAANDDCPQKVRRGDVVGVTRLGGAFEHYGVYVSKREVIHYTSDDSDVGDNKIMATSFKRFLRGADEFFVLNFPDKPGKPSKSGGLDMSSIIGGTPRLSLPLATWLLDWLRESDYKRFSPKDVVKRARKKIGEDKYSVVFNNCEHFAIWCATNVHESHQVQRLVESVGKVPIVYS